MSDNPAVIRKLEGMGKNMINEIEKGDGPTFETTLRTKSNTKFDETYQCLRTGNKKETRKFLSVAQARTFMQTVAIATKTKQFLAQDLHTSIRGLFYQLKFSLGDNLDEDLFTEQTESNALVEDLEVALGIKREDLNLTTDRKGFVAGDMVITDKFGGEETTIDLSKQGRSGWSIPSDVDNGMEITSLDAEYVLVVEKDALWQRLNEDKFWKKENCLLVTPKGQSTRGTRRLLRKLADKKLPVYCLMDCDAWGWYIYWTIKTGSMNLAYLGMDFAVPESRFLGVTMSDIKEFKFLDKLTINAKDVDVKRAEEMLGYPWINRHKDWVHELKLVLKTKKKIEQDALQGERLTFVGEYIKQKIDNKEWLS
ncbi:DNA topoisomerase IV subunit A [Candidatus Micrarchaeota archaeon]|nr:DNA topoisomerase IV subunit A [Candidatus Micrarchaeota archaeon]MBU1166228.1 DNA topoisomerase IV subunit A [Candidatus Micrarchaeota archaeon]MBU1886201.1 DNA topoisomerase IV subunit A [Candidatus Micrarchaeota archaeon]